MWQPDWQRPPWQTSPAQHCASLTHFDWGAGAAGLHWSSAAAGRTTSTESVAARRYASSRVRPCGPERKDRVVVAIVGLLSAREERPVYRRAGPYCEAVYSRYYGRAPYRGLMIARQEKCSPARKVIVHSCDSETVRVRVGCPISRWKRTRSWQPKPGTAWLSHLGTSCDR